MRRAGPSRGAPLLANQNQGTGKSDFKVPRTGRGGIIRLLGVRMSSEESEEFRGCGPRRSSQGPGLPRGGMTYNIRERMPPLFPLDLRMLLASVSRLWWTSPHQPGFRRSGKPVQGSAGGLVTRNHRPGANVEANLAHLPRMLFFSSPRAPPSSRFLPNTHG